jgi:hypothetical protein
MNSLLFNSDLPSNRRALLDSLLGQRLVELVRYSWLPPAQAAADYALADAQVFGRTAGALALSLESGLVIGVASEPSKNSVIVWLERDERGSVREDSLARDVELHPVSAADPRYADARFAAAAGARIRRVRALRRVGQSVRHDDLPSEAALELELDRGDPIVLAHGLHDDSDDFAVLHPDEIMPGIAPTLRELFAIP